MIPPRFGADLLKSKVDCERKKNRRRKRLIQQVAERGELTRSKCYRGGAVDEASGDTLTQIRGYPSHDHESVRQTRGSGPQHSESCTFAERLIISLQHRSIEHLAVNTLA